MARMIGAIPNFINGISQQPAALRLASQGEAQENCYSTVAKGLIRRPPTEQITKIAASADSSAAVHIINRDTTERYVVVYDATNGLRVYDFEGTAQTVSGASTYLSCSDPSTQLKFLTVADYTFIVNTTDVVEEDTTTAAERPYEALISFGTVQPGSTIKVYIDGTEEASLTTSDTDPSDLETNYAAAQILSGLVASGFNTAPWSCSLTQAGGSVIYIKNTSTDFTLTVRDGSNGLGIKPLKNKVQYFEDLPREGLAGFKIEVAGDPVTGFGSYWVEFESDTIPVWKETIKPGIKTKIKASTMPHTLVRTGASTFTFGPMTLVDRAVGTDTTNPMPSFIGETINDVLFHKSRLAFLAGEGLVMSEAGEFFNFFRTTVTTLLDSDPIDISSNHTKVSILRHAVSYQEQLLLFSDQTQFRLTQADILSPATVGIEPITEYESSQVAAPSPIGNFIFFAVEKSDYASIREYYVADDNQRNDGREITGHIPEYIPTGVVKLAGSSNEDCMVVKTTGSAANELYIYKYFWSGNEKVQSSWSKWSFPDVTLVMGFGFIKSTLYMVMKRADGIFLEKAEFDTGYQDDSNTGVNYCLDRKVFSSDSGNVSAAYNSGTDQTTYTFTDMVWKSVPYVIGNEGNSPDYAPGYYVPIVGLPTTYDSNLIVVAGDTTGESLTFGIPYTSTYQVSEIVPKGGGAGGSEVPITEGRLQVLWMNLRYSYSGYFVVTVTPERRAANIYEFNGRTLGSLENPLNDLPVDASGFFRFPVLSRSDRVSIVITSDDPLPFRIVSADWIGNMHTKFKRA